MLSEDPDAMKNGVSPTDNEQIRAWVLGESDTVAASRMKMKKYSDIEAVMSAKLMFNSM